MPHNSWKLRIDTGGTFTDCIAHTPDGEIRRCKVLSSGALRGRILNRLSNTSLRIEQTWKAADQFVKKFRFTAVFGGVEHSAEVVAFDTDNSILELDKSIPNELEGVTFELDSGLEAPVLAARLITGTPSGTPLPELDLRIATTRGTNALLERRGGNTTLLVTEGFADLPIIGDQSRPELFSLRVNRPAPLSKQILEIPERIDPDGRVVRPLDPADLEYILDKIDVETESVGICLMNSYRNPVHEQQIAEALRQRGHTLISISSELSNKIKIIPRIRSCDINAYLSPPMTGYLKAIREQTGLDRFSVMTSTGSLTGDRLYQPKDGLLSGPAGGVAGAAVSGKNARADKIIAFDMGGTSTDVSRYDDGFDYLHEHTVGGVTLSSPALSIETVAAGGGSICGFDGQSLTVGPESAGADPGPACYGTGGPLTITDVNLLSGRLDPANFHLPVSPGAARERFDELHHRVQRAGDDLTATELMEGLLEIANEKMSQAISQVSTAAGFNPADYTMVSFGGAGGQHATAVAGRLGIRRILLPPDSGLLSAYGLDHARMEKIVTETILSRLSDLETSLYSKFEQLKNQAAQQLQAEDVPEKRIEILEETLLARLEGQENTLELEWKNGKEPAERFRERYRVIFGHWIDNREIEVESIRVIAARRENPPSHSENVASGSRAPFRSRRPIHCRGRKVQLTLYDRKDLLPGSEIDVPALVLDPWTTLFVEPGWRVTVRSDRTLDIHRKTIPGTSPGMEDSSSSGVSESSSSDSAVKAGFRPESEQAEPTGNHDSIQLQLYTNRFSSIARRMGEMLRRTSLSVNVKERLDFSCALLDRNGHLVVNAPHIPVHLGAMGHCVRTLLKEIEPEEGDVLLTNHPGYGGSHLPDITVVTPVFDRGERIAFVASRAHHSEIGGRRPGSMPPDAESLAEEGVVLPPMKLLHRGEADWEGIHRLLTEGRWPSRSPDENLADLQAAVSANHHGTTLVRNLTDDFGKDQVLTFMKQLKRYAADRMRQTLLELEDGNRHAVEHLDDGSPLEVTCRLSNGELEIDFSGSAPVHPGNLNANPSIVHSVVIYLLRLLVREPLPLNDGLLEPVSIRIPEGLLNPDFPSDPQQCPAVVGGNIETSQRLVDTLLKAFRMAGCSQGTMNNVLFGNDRFGYYETIAGGTGAGNGFHGTGGVHHHMTNTRATDPEVMEFRYPVRLNRFSLRRGSGGQGTWNGGDGVIREITFLEPVELSLLTQHRNVTPYGMNGGGPARTGRQVVIRNDGSRRKLEWKDAATVQPGDRLLIETPGGGGYGRGDNSL